MIQRRYKLTDEHTDGRTSVTISGPCACALSLY